MLAAAAGVVAFLARQESGNITAYTQYGAGARLALAAYTLWFSWWTSLWPAGLSPMYELPQRVDLGQARFLGPLLAVIALTATLVLLRRRWPAGLAAWAQSVIVLVPISGVVHSGIPARRRPLQLSREPGIVGPGRRRARLDLAAAPPTGRRGAGCIPSRGCRPRCSWCRIGATARAQTVIWKDSETLWRRAVEVDPTCSLCESNLGRVVARPGRFPEGETHLRRAIALRPDRPGPHENMGTIMLAQGRHPEAEEHFRRAATLQPDRAASRNALGVALATPGTRPRGRGRVPGGGAAVAPTRGRPRQSGRALCEAAAASRRRSPPLRRALALDGGRAGVRADLGRALRSRAIELAREGRLDEAARLWQEASPLAGEDPDLLRALGQALVERGKGVEAIPVLERAVALAPQRGAERLWLARAYRLAGRMPEADREAATLRTLAPAYATELGR